MENMQVWSKRPCTGLAHVSSLFGVHREMAKGYEMHGLASQISQGRKGIDHRKEVIEVSESNIKDEEASYSCECREEEWEARMKREVL